MSSLDFKTSTAESLVDITVLSGLYKNPEKKCPKLESSGNNCKSSGTEEIHNVPVVSLSEVIKQEESEVGTQGFFSKPLFLNSFG